jgi:hypothetical protein
LQFSLQISDLASIIQYLLAHALPLRIPVIRVEEEKVGANMDFQFKELI